MASRLFICITPLQMLIAERLIENNPSYENDFICMYYDNNEKYDYYYERLKSKCQTSSKFLISDNGGIIKLLELFRLYFLLGSNFKKKYEIISFASIDSFFIHYICSKISFDRIETFDDGAANFFKNGLYYAKKEYSVSTKAIKKIFNIKYDMQVLKGEIDKHYTICRNLSNIIDNPIFLSLFNDIGSLNKSENFISIFLGQPFHEYGLNSDIDIKNVVSELKIDFYYPHPREKKNNFEIEKIVSNKIFEDYVKELRSDGYIVKVYAFLSTALLNLNGQNGVKCYLIHNEELYRKYIELYKIYEEAGIEIIDLENIV